MEEVCTLSGSLRMSLKSSQAFHRDDVMGERRQRPDAVGGLFQIKFEKGKVAGYVILFFFYHEAHQL